MTRPPSRSPVALIVPVAVTVVKVCAAEKLFAMFVLATFAAFAVTRFASAFRSASTLTKAVLRMPPHAPKSPETTGVAHP